MANDVQFGSSQDSATFNRFEFGNHIAENRDALRLRRECYGRDSDGTSSGLAYGNGHNAVMHALDA